MPKDLSGYVTTYYDLRLKEIDCLENNIR